MKSFKLFFAEEAEVIAEAAMQASGATADDHVSKYLQPDQLKTLKYKLAKDTGGGKAGEEVQIKKLVPTTTMDGSVKYHAHIKHGNGTAIVPINHIMKPKGVGRAGGNPEKEEDSAVEELHSKIQNSVKDGNGSHITVTHSGKTYKIAGARKVVAGDFAGRKPKGDIILHDHTGKPQIFLSHKASAKATGAQNYEGTSSHSYNGQVGKFASDLKDKFPKGLTNGQSFVRRFTTNTKADKALHRSVMFGSEHDSNERGVHNVHSIAHGKIGIEPTGKGGKFQLTSDKFIHNDDTFKHEDHPVEFTARYAARRGDHQIDNARIGIARVGSRPSSKEF